MRRLSLIAALALGACSGRPPEAPGGTALVDLWAAVPVGMAALAEAEVPEVCDGPFGTWFEDFGVRGLACAADRAVRLGDAAARAPGPVWTGGPHRLDEAGLHLDLRAPDTFGRYDPAFVEWAVANVVPRTEAGVRVAQPVYDRYVRRLARVYWLVYRDLADEGFPARVPEGPAGAYAASLDGGPAPEAPGYDGGLSMHTLFSDRSDGIVAQLVPRGGYEWHVRYEANTAYGFWIRRRADGTAGLFSDGLRDLVGTFDPAWSSGLRG